MTGREEQLKMLEEHFQSDKNNLTILYGRRGIGKTALLREFMKNKRAFYYEARAGADFEQRSCLARAAEAEDGAADYEEIFARLEEKGTELFIIEEFQNPVKADPAFMPAVVKLLHNSDHRVMVVLSCSSVSWVENSMVKAIGTAAYSINTFLKLKELTYVDMVSLFPQCDAKTILAIYAVTGGVPAYVREWKEELSVRDNICNLVLRDSGSLYAEAERYVAEEFRESGVYFAILSCLAGGRNKLNEIHEYTGYGRDKISVYLKNLIEREIVEKIFSYDIAGRENTKKGLYRIREPFLNFWFRTVYPNAGILAVTEPVAFYERYVAPDLAECLLPAYMRVAESFLTIMEDMGRLPFACSFKGSWYGKRGNLHLIYEGEDGRILIGNVFVKDSPVTLEDYDKVCDTVVQAGFVCSRYYLFSIAGFAPELAGRSETELIRIEDL